MSTTALVAALLYVVIQQPSFRTGVELVRLPVSVTQSDGALADHDALKADDFSITEDGISQQAAIFERELVPLSLCIVFDVSHSMGEKSTAHLAAGAYGHLVSRLSKADEVSVITFAMDAKVAIPWTASSDVAQQPLTLNTRAGTAIIDGVKSALRQVDRTSRRRPIILLITDGGENASQTSISDVVSTRRQSETQIYAFKISTPPSPPRSPAATVDSLGRIRARSTPRRPAAVAATLDVLPQLIDDSGGQTFSVRSESDVPSVAQQFLDAARWQYTIAYSPAKEFDGKYRRVTVAVTRPGYVVRHRSGYLALPHREQ